MKKFVAIKEVKLNGIYHLKEYKILPNYLLRMPKTMKKLDYKVKSISNNIVFLTTENEIGLPIAEIGIDIDTFKEYWDEVIVDSDSKVVFKATGTLNDNNGRYLWRVNGRRTYVRYYPYNANSKDEYYKGRATCHKEDLKNFDYELGVKLACNRAKIKFIQSNIEKLTQQENNFEKNNYNENKQEENKYKEKYNNIKEFTIGSEVLYRHNNAIILSIIEEDIIHRTYAVIKYKYNTVKNFEIVPLDELILLPKNSNNNNNIW